MYEGGDSRQSDEFCIICDIVICSSYYAIMLSIAWIRCHIFLYIANKTPLSRSFSHLEKAYECRLGYQSVYRYLFLKNNHKIHNRNCGAIDVQSYIFCMQCHLKSRLHT